MKLPHLLLPSLLLLPLLLACLTPPAAHAAHAAPAAADDCGDKPFASDVRPARGAAVPLKSRQIMPPEIARLKNGVLLFYAAIPPGLGYYQLWMAYDADRALFITVDSQSYERQRPKPWRKLQGSQRLRFVRDEGFNRAEVVTVKAASATQVRDMACLGNRAAAAIAADRSPEQPFAPPADGWSRIHVIVHGAPLANPAPSATPLRLQLQSRLQAALAGTFEYN